jgi:hypothetical protein
MQNTNGKYLKKISEYKSSQTGVSSVANQTTFSLPLS